MTPYRTIVTVKNPSELVLTDVPVQPGDRVEVVVRPQSKKRINEVEKVKKLLAETHSLPQLQNITEKDISAEIDAYRNGQ